MPNAEHGFWCTADPQQLIISKAGITGYLIGDGRNYLVLCPTHCWHPLGPALLFTETEDKKNVGSEGREVKRVRCGRQNESKQHPRAGPPRGCLSHHSCL